MNKKGEPTFTGLVAACLLFPIVIPILLLVFVRKTVMSLLKWSWS